MKTIQEGYERLQKAKRRLKHEHSWGILGCVFVGCEGPRRDESCNPRLCSHGNGSIWGVYEWKKWHMADLDIFTLGKTFQEIVCEKGEALTEPFKEDFWGIQEKLLHPASWFGCKSFSWMPQKSSLNGSVNASCVLSRTCSRLGFKGFLADHGCGTVPVPKETTQITSSSHNTNLTNHIHLTHQAIAILYWWDDTAHHCCSVNLLGLGMTHIACLPPDPTVHVAWL